MKGWYCQTETSGQQRKMYFGTVSDDDHKLNHGLTNLASPPLSMLLLDLDLAHVAWMLDDLGNERLVSASNLSCDALGQV